MDGKPKIERKPHPRENAFILSKATFFHTIPIFIRGFRKGLEESDLTEPLSSHRSSKLGDQLDKYWEEEKERAAIKCVTPSLGRVLFRMFGLEFLFYGLLLAISDSFLIAQPMFLGQLIQYFNPGSTTPKSHAFLSAGGVVGCSLLYVISFHPYMLGVLTLGMKTRIACCSLIYRKSLKLNKTALAETTVGQLVNLLSNDVNRFDVSILFAHYLWIGPLETIICTYLIYQQLKEASILGVLILITFIPLQIFFGKRISKYRLRTALRTDERVRLMNEIISGIQVIKMYAWEKPFTRLVAMARRLEIKAIKSTFIMRGIMYSFTMYSTRISIFASILCYVLLGNGLTAENVFVVTSFYSLLRQSLTIFFPQAIVQVAEAIVSIGRLNKFLLYEEMESKESENKLKKLTTTNRKIKPVLYSIELNGFYDKRNNDKEKEVILQNVSAKWNSNASENTLNYLNLTATSGKLVAVIGPVGCGKSSFLHTILKELTITSGTLTVAGEISYASQEPWLFSGSVRQNILFGAPMDKARYKNVVKHCALERDFSLFPYSDKTLVGDKGIGLSGGQKARINLARAVYKEADIYLLDDPLSAVDSRVGRQLFDCCINGYLKPKIVILVTHQLQYLKDADHIVYLENGSIKAQGTFEKLVTSGLDFTNLLKNDNDEDEDEEEEGPEPLKKCTSLKSITSVADAPKEEQEQKVQGTVDVKIYSNYFKAGGNWMLLFALFLLAQLFLSSADYFLSYWVNMEQVHGVHLNNSVYLNDSWQINLTYPKGNLTITRDDDLPEYPAINRNTSILIYSVLIVGLVIVSLARSITFFSFCMRASINLHNNMFESISRATMRFFNINNTGRILNRFSKDIGSIDEMLPASLIDALQIFLILFGIVIVISVVNPWIIIPTAVVGCTFYLFRTIFVKTSREVKRLEGITRSPVFGHLSASLLGLTTIRAFHAEEILTKEFDSHQDLHSSAWYTFLYISRGFGYYSDMVCVIYLACLTFSFLIFQNHELGGNVGLVITQAIGITGMFQWGMRQSAELENLMTCVERVVEYSNVESEGELESSPNKKPPATWPDKGEVEFRNVFLRYSPDDLPVLRNLNFVIKSKEKVGIVGRTGAGKSSLINALFQLSPTEGDIIIDGINVTKIGLHDLRKKISIIPQEPVLFSGTLRSNLDPFEEYTDEILWKALEDVELKTAVNELDFGLSSKISEGGSNFSVGQRQLICLARALLRNNKILVMDEATANVDPQTDSLIQTTIRNKFSECTVLTIAHRLHTVVDSDKVLVMDAGTLKEFGHPYELLQNKDGFFYQMVQQTGKGMSDNLEKAAFEQFNKLKQV